MRTLLARSEESALCHCADRGCKYRPQVNDLKANCIAPASAFDDYNEYCLRTILASHIQKRVQAPLTPWSSKMTFTDASTTRHLVVLCERLKRMGYSKDKQMRIYGEEFELVSDPIAISEHLFVVDAIERKSRSPRRVRIPLNIVNML